MKPICFAMVVACLAASGARAQGLDEPVAVPDLAPAPLVPKPAPSSAVLLQPQAPTLSSTPALSQPFAGIQPIPRTYLRNEAETDRVPRLPSAFGRWVTDPRLLAGVRLTPFLALEAGYAELYDRGTHFVDYRYGAEAAGALNVKGFSSHVAGRLTLPLGERIEAFGKAGVAISEYKRPEVAGGLAVDMAARPSGTMVAPPSNTDIGPYVGAGAKYKLTEKMSVSGSVERYGNSDKWGAKTNNNAVKAKVNLGF